MRKVIFIGLFVFLTVVGGGWCVSWYLQADESKKSLEAMIAKVNAEKTYISHDGITTSGFPTHVVLTIANPRLTGKMNELLMQLDEQKTLFPKGLPEWQEEMKLSGTIKLTVSALSDQYTMETTGKWAQNSDIEGKAPVRLSTADVFSQKCSLTMEKGTFFDNMWNFKLFENNGEEFIEHFRGLDCNSSSYTMVDSTSGAVFMSMGPSTLFISNNPTDGHNDFRFYIKSTDAEITSNGEDWIHSYVSMMAPNTFYPKTYAYYGKQNIEVDFSFKGPSFDEKDPTNGPFEISLSKLNISNKLYNGNGHFILKNESSDASAIKGSLDTKFTFEYTKHYDDLLKHMAYSFIKHAATANDPMTAGFKKTITDSSPEHVYAMIAPAIPNLSTLGTWVQAVNVSVDADKNFTSGSVNLADFNFSVTPYGLTGKGTAERTKDVPFPQANFTFDCSSCTLLVDDLTSYINKVMGVAQALSPEDPKYSYRISAELISGTKQFLAKLSASTAEENAKGNYKFLLVSDKTGNMTVSGQNFMEVMGLYQQSIGQQIMPKPAGQPQAGQALPQGGNIPAQGWKVQ